jgi:tetraacyldisaccharide 4'-kinase
MILTTEKDAMRLMKFSAPFTNYPVYVIPIAIRFLFEQEQAFTGLIVNFIARYEKEKQQI